MINTVKIKQESGKIASFNFLASSEFANQLKRAFPTLGKDDYFVGNTDGDDQYVSVNAALAKPDHLADGGVWVLVKCSDQDAEEVTNFGLFSLLSTTTSTSSAMSTQPVVGEKGHPAVEADETPSNEVWIPKVANISNNNTEITTTEADNEKNEQNRRPDKKITADGENITADTSCERFKHPRKPAATIIERDDTKTKTITTEAGDKQHQRRRIVNLSPEFVIAADSKQELTHNPESTIIDGIGLEAATNEILIAASSEYRGDTLGDPHEDRSSLSSNTCGRDEDDDDEKEENGEGEEEDDWSMGSEDNDTGCWWESNHGQEDEKLIGLGDAAAADADADAAADASAIASSATTETTNLHPKIFTRLSGSGFKAQKRRSSEEGYADSSGLQEERECGAADAQGAKNKKIKKSKESLRVPERLKNIGDSLRLSLREGCSDKQPGLQLLPTVEANIARIAQHARIYDFATKFDNARNVIDYFCKGEGGSSGYAVQFNEQIIGFLGLYVLEKVDAQGYPQGYKLKNYNMKTCSPNFVRIYAICDDLEKHEAEFVNAWCFFVEKLLAVEEVNGCCLMLDEAEEPDSLYRRLADSVGMLGIGDDSRYFQSRRRRVKLLVLRKTR